MRIKSAIKRLVQQGLGLVGLELRRTRGWKGLTNTARRIARESADSADPGPLRIEFFGVSGVGKSFFGEKLHQSRTARDGWLTDQEVLAARLGLPESDSKMIEAYLDLFGRQSAITLNSTAPVSRSLELMCIAAKKLHEDLRLSICGMQYWVLRNDGILHNFTDALLQQSEASPGHLRRIIRFRAGIHCTAPAEVVADRIVMRASQGGYPASARGS